MPNLRSLKLRGLLVSLEHVAGLGHLDLDHCLWSLPFRSISHIVPMWLRLWELHLKHSLNCFPGPGQQLTGESAVQSRVLLMLRTLQVEDHNVENIAALIYSLELPFARTVDILYKVPCPAPADEAHYSLRSVFGGLAERNLLAVFKGLPTGMLFGIWFHLHPGTASVTVHNNEYAVRYEDEAHSATLRIATAFDRDWSRALPSALQDLIEFFPRVRISTLVVRGDPYHVSIALWEDIFVKWCRDLETLRLTGNGSWLAAWRALSGRHTLPIEADDQQAHERARALGRLRIKKVYIQHVSRPDDNFPAPPDERVLEEIRAVLSHLSKSGRRLQELRWEVQRSRHLDFDDARRRFMKALSPYVDRLSYEDSESWNDPARLPVIGHGTKVPPSRLDATMLHEELMELRRLLRA
ncbi:hypothetical protein BN946_scf185033.g28 [Trametes cinnabarina]|uniref:Uncharacterized protein n=1 Tax=Pycnoporus cinnabarinus TaxID=5643 RepID=A0A060SRS1_PYCCI|nr:hypothetical protein BN946_scf185033.g28 [Trametes cinnabarina]